MSGALRYVVLHHTGWPGRPDHYDLMLQLEPGADDDDAVLRVFASVCDKFPDGTSHADFQTRRDSSGDPTDETNLLRMIDDHRRAYLSHEGEVRGGRGTVARVEAGELTWLRPPGGGIQEYRFDCRGARLKGGYRLRHMGGGVYVFERLRRVVT